MEKKSISFIIEQGMILLDKVRLLSSNISNKYLFESTTIDLSY
jgi:hypothetical protein